MVCCSAAGRSALASLTGSLNHFFSLIVTWRTSTYMGLRTETLLLLMASTMIGFRPGRERMNHRTPWDHGCRT